MAPQRQVVRRLLALALLPVLAAALTGGSGSAAWSAADGPASPGTAAAAPGSGSPATAGTPAPPPAPPPPPPQWVSAVDRGGQAVLTWTRDPRAAAVRVYRSAAEGSGGFALIGEERGNTLTDLQVAPGVAYRYRLAAVGADGNQGRYSSELTVRIGLVSLQPPAAPAWEGFLSFEKGIGLKWGEQENVDVILYNVYRKPPPEQNFQLIGSSRETSFIDTGVEPGKPQVYALTALNSSLMETDFSPELHAVYQPPRLGGDRGAASEWRPRRTRLVRIAGGGAPSLLRPADVAVGPRTGNVYLSDSGRNLVYVFDGSGTFLRTIGDPQGALSAFRRLLGLAVDRDETLYAVDAGREAVLAYPGGSGAGRAIDLPRPPRQHQPGLVDCAVGADGLLFVVDNTNNRVLMAGPGRPADLLGATGFKAGELSAPTFGAIDAAGNLLVADTLNARVQVFSAAGEFVRAFGRSERETPLGRPKGIAVHPSGDIYVADSWLNVIRVFGPTGKPKEVLVDERGEPLDLGSPNGIAFGAGNRIYIAERLSARLQIREILDDAQ